MPADDVRARSVKLRSLDDATQFPLDEERMARLLEEQVECAFAWTNRDGDPVVITQAFVYHDGFIWLCSEESRARVKAIRRDPRTAVTISSLGTSLGKTKTVAFKGRSEILDDRDTILWFLWEVARKYDPNDEQLQAAHVQAADHPGRVVIKFTREKVTNTFDGAKVRERS